MKITINPTFDWETLDLVSHDGQYEYSGPIALAKGGMQQALQNFGTANGLEKTYVGAAAGDSADILPFLNSEMTDPAGFGQTGVDELLTSGGQAVSGAVGAGNEAANLHASRMGNLSSSSSIIDAITRSGAAQQSNNALNVNTANLKEKLNQQQAGESGIAALGDEDMNAALASLGLSNQSVSDYTNAYKATGGPLGPFAAGAGNLLSGISSIGGIASGIGAAI